MKRIAIALCAAFILLAAMAPRPAVAEETGLGEALVGDSTPLTLKVGDLTGVWRLVTIDAGSAPLATDAAAADPAVASLHAFLRGVGAAPDVYFTQGRLVSAGGESFLVAYRMQYNERDFNDFVASYRRGHQEPPVAGTPLIGALPVDAVSSFVLNRSLKLILINVRRIDGVMEVRAYNLDSAIAAAETTPGPSSAPTNSITPAPSVTVAPSTLPAPATQPAAPSQPAAPVPVAATPAPPTPPPGLAPPGLAPPGLSPEGVAPPAPASPGAAPQAPAQPAAVHHLSHAVAVNDLRHIGDAMEMYILDHDGTLPPLSDSKTAFSALFADPNVFGQGENEPAILPNPILSLHKVAHIVNPTEFVAFYEAAPAADGTRGVLFLDNHVATVNAHDWMHFKKASKMP